MLPDSTPPLSEVGGVWWCGVGGRGRIRYPNLAHHQKNEQVLCKLSSQLLTISLETLSTLCSQSSFFHGGLKVITWSCNYVNSWVQGYEYGIHVLHVHVVLCTHTDPLVSDVCPHVHVQLYLEAKTRVTDCGKL